MSSGQSDTSTASVRGDGIVVPSRSPRSADDTDRAASPALRWQADESVPSASGRQTQRRQSSARR